MPAAAAAAGGGTGTGSAATGGVSGRCTTFGAATTGALIAGCTGALAVRGASTSAEYSRTSRPWPQSTSIRKFSTAWSTGATVVTRITGRPRASLPRLNCRLAAAPVGAARPIRRNVSGEARRACSACSSPGVVEMIGISASSGWLSRDLTSICPRPSAAALPAASSSPVNTAIRNLPITRAPDVLPRSDSSRAQPSLATSSAICTAFRAAPLRMLSDTIHRFSPRGCDRSSRMRPTYTGSVPDAWVTGVG